MKHHKPAARAGLFLLAALTAVSLTGCGKRVTLDYLEEQPVLNYTAPAEGEEIVVIHVRDYGDIKFKLFPELLPEACENFTTLAREGYYDELIFHRVIEDFMIQGGDPRGDGFGGESCWGGFFDGGWTPQLLHLPGALAYANSGDTSTDGSQFYIVKGQPVSENELNYYTAEANIYYTEEARQLYCANGGYPSLDGGSYTVFGQLIDGLDVVYAISAVETGDNDKPQKAVCIDSVTVEQYDGSEIRFYPADYGFTTGSTK